MVGSSVTFQCRVGGEPLPDVLWRRTASGGNMPLGKCNAMRGTKTPESNEYFRFGKQIDQLAKRAHRSIHAIESPPRLLPPPPPVYLVHIRW